MAGSESDSDWEDVEEGSAPGPLCRCLFCPGELQDARDVLEHCKTEHGFELLNFAAKHCLEFYSCVKLVNYIRSQCPASADLLSLKPPFPWEQERYFKPVLEDDPLLQLDFECVDGDGGDAGAVSEGGAVGEGGDAGKGGEDGAVGDGMGGDGAQVDTNDHSSKTESVPRVAQTERRRVEEYREALSQALLDLDSMRSAMRELFSEDTDSKASDVMAEEDGLEDGYFSTYSHISIHEEMLKDEVRTETYRQFIMKNTELFKDKVVLDIGCGTGILSMFAAKLGGARKVIGVDQSDIIYKAMDIIRENGLEDRITLVKGRVEEVELPVDKVDVIISEWMGYFLLFESMLDTVIFARDKWLADTSNVFPNKCSISVVAMGDVTEWDSRVKFWDDVYGFKMSCLKRDVFREAQVHVVDSYSLISSSDMIKKFDISKVGSGELNFEAPFSITMQHHTTCHALVGYFDVHFDTTRGSCLFSTSPQDTPTHWRQTVFYLKEPIQVTTGDLLVGRMCVCKSKQDPRGLDITLDIEHCSFLAEAKPYKVTQKFTLS